MFYANFHASRKILIGMILFVIMDLEKAIMKRFLRKLVNLNIWGGRHTELRNLQKSLPDHLRGSKEAKKAVKELANMELIIIKPSTGELHVSLNSHKQQEIYKFLSEDDSRG